MQPEDYQTYIEVCANCVLACEYCASACLQEVEVEKMTRCITLDRSCADICSLTMRELARESDFIPRLCQLCAEICTACAQECGQHKMDHCQQCAEACLRCAEACETISQNV